MQNRTSNVSWSSLILENHRELMVCILGNGGFGSVRSTMPIIYDSIFCPYLLLSPNMWPQIKVTKVTIRWEGGGKRWKSLTSILVEFLSSFRSKCFFLIKSLKLTWRECPLKKEIEYPTLTKAWVHYLVMRAWVSLQNNDIANVVSLFKAIWILYNSIIETLFWSCQNKKVMFQEPQFLK